MVTVAELNEQRDALNKEIMNTYDVLTVDLLKNTLTDINCKIIKLLMKRR
jgi:hypothetical protein